MACNQHFQFPDISFAYCYAFLFLLFHKIYNLCYPQLVGAIAFNSGRHQSKNIYEIIKNFSGWNRSVFDLLHFRDWFQIKMNFNRNKKLPAVVTEKVSILFREVPSEWQARTSGQAGSPIVFPALRQRSIEYCGLRTPAAHWAEQDFLVGDFGFIGIIFLLLVVLGE